tara:strand:- start:24 stop:401 length:378 start_codon:yes stop_codon:yes gene_type:complete
MHSPRSGFKFRHQCFVTMLRTLLVSDIACQFEAAFFRDFGAFLDDVDSRFVSKFISGRPHFQRKLDIAGDDIYRVRAYGDLSNRSDKPVGIPSMAFNGNNHFRGAGKGVGAKRYWHGAGMARLAK